MPGPQYISALEWQLLSFFEVEPTTLDAEVGWPYNSFTYDARRDSRRILFSVAPAYKDFTLTIEYDGSKEIEFTALSVFDIRYREESRTEWLELWITDTQVLELRLKPHFSLSETWTQSSERGR